MLLTNTQFSRIRKAFENGSLANIKILKTHFHKIGQLGTLQKNSLPLMKNVRRPLAKTLLIPLGIKVATSATDAAVQKKKFRSGMLSSKSLKNTGLFIRGVGETIKNEQNNKNLDFSVCCKVH